MAVGSADSTQSMNDLVEEYLDVVHSPRNQSNRAKWDHTFLWERDNWRALPLGGRFVIDPDRGFLSKFLKFDLARFYQDPEVQLREWLRMNIFRHEQLEDDTYYSARYCPWWSVVTEISLFGVPLLFRSDREPWIGSPPLLEDKRALDRLVPPDLHTTGLMPAMHRFYDYASDMLGSRMAVLFPTWVRGPLCTAMQLRGMHNLLLDTYEDPPFVHRLMRFVTDCRKAWLTERARVLGVRIQPGLLFNDEVGVPLISPKIYREFVLPYELELAQFHAGIFYWHSCGNTSAFLADIATIPGLQLFHVGPHTDLAAVVQNIRPDIALDICLQDVRDIYDADEAQMRGKLERILELCGGRRFYVRADGFDVLTTAERDFAKIRAWCDIARDIFREGEL